MQQINLRSSSKFFFFFQPSLNNTLTPRHQLPDFDDFQPLRLQQLLPLRLRSFHASVQTHHLDIQRSRKQSCPSLRQHELAYEKLGVAITHGGRGVPKDLTTSVIGPIMEDGAEMIGAGVYHVEWRWFKSAIDLGGSGILTRYDYFEIENEILRMAEGAPTFYRLRLKEIVRHCEYARVAKYQLIYNRREILENEFPWQMRVFGSQVE